MRVTVLTTHTNNTPAFYEPLRALGHEVFIIVYDIISQDAFHHLPWMVDANKPDFVVWIGAHPQFHPRPIPDIPLLAKIGKKYPFINLCCDGAEPVWWPVLQEYYDNKVFTVQVNIDGVRTGPIGDRGLTLLSPFDPGLYPDPPRPWGARTVELAFPGQAGNHPRSTILMDLVNRGVITFRPRTDGNPEAYRDYLETCKCIWNHPSTGSTERKHVKGRTIEAAHAGALLFEQEGSPLEDWFESGKDYLTYNSAEDVVNKLNWVRVNLTEAETMAGRLRAKVLRDHSPAIFWSHVLSAIGLAKSERKVPVVPKREWAFPKPAAPIAIHAPITYAPPPNGGTPTPRLVASRKGYNLAEFCGEYFLIPQRLGKINLDKAVDRDKPGIRKFRSEGEAMSVLGNV